MVRVFSYFRVVGWAFSSNGIMGLSRKAYVVGPITILGNTCEKHKRKNQLINFMIIFTTSSI